MAVTRRALLARLPAYPLPIPSYVQNNGLLPGQCPSREAKFTPEVNFFKKSTFLLSKIWGRAIAHFKDREKLGRSSRANL